MAHGYNLKRATAKGNHPRVYLPPLPLHSVPVPKPPKSCTMHGAPSSVLALGCPRSMSS